MFTYWSQSNPNRPSHHANDQGTAFQNPWPSASAPTWAELLQVSFPLGWYQEPLHKHIRARDMKVISPDWGKTSLEAQGFRKDNCVVGTWLGHAGACAEIPLQHTAANGDQKKSFWVVYDPIFSMRAGPTPNTGPARLRGNPCEVTDLPGCDAVLVSHNHYDHLDLSSIQAIFKAFPKAKYFVPLGLAAWLQSSGIPKDLVYELDWWQNRDYNLQDLGYDVDDSAGEETTLRFTCVPAQHNSGRGARDQGQTLWCGWVVEQLLHSKDHSKVSSTKRCGAIYHAGDTGYRRTSRSSAVCPVFKEIGQKLGPFDLSFIPIWRGGSLGFVSYMGLRLSHHDLPSGLHTSPADAIDIHKDVLSRNTLGVHFGTFIGSENESYEAIIEFEDAREEQNIMSISEKSVGQQGRAGTIDIGGSLAVEIVVSAPVLTPSDIEPLVVL